MTLRRKKIKKRDKFPQKTKLKEDKKKTFNTYESIKIND